MYPKYFFFFLLFSLIFASCKLNSKKGNTSQSVDSLRVTHGDVKDFAQSRFFRENPTIKDCFFVLDTQILPISPAFRLQMWNNYEIRETLHQKQKWRDDFTPQIYEYEIDNMDTLHQYLMFSVFNKQKEINFFLRYFKDSTGNENHAVAVAYIEKQGGKRLCRYRFLEQQYDTLVRNDSVFTPITLRDFADENHLTNLSAEQIQQPELIVWLPRASDKIGIDLNVEYYNIHNFALKQHLRRTHFNLLWEDEIFDKEELPIAARKIKQNRYKQLKSRIQKSRRSRVAQRKKQSPITTKSKAKSSPTKSKKRR